METTKPQKFDPKLMRQFLADAGKKAVAARNILAIDAETAYQTAYLAMLKASMALMLSYGQRSRVQPADHVAIIEFSRKHVDPAYAIDFALFDRMRSKHDETFYDIAIITAEEAEEAVAAAEQYVDIVSDEIQNRFA